MSIACNEVSLPARLHWQHLPETLKPSETPLGSHPISKAFPVSVRTWLLLERMAQARGAYQPVDVPGVAANWLACREHWIAEHNRAKG